MGLPKISLADQNARPDFVNPASIFDLLNFRVSELIGVSGSLVTRICESEYGITREAWQFIAMLAQLGPTSPSDLAARTTVDRSQTSKTLRGLIAKGLLERQRVPGDGRRACVLLTTEGQRLYNDLFPRVVQLHHAVLADLSTEDRRVLASTLSGLQNRALTVARQYPTAAGQGRRVGGARATWTTALTQGAP
jgi:DNA-binding MarR family transcriptional regulator